MTSEQITEALKKMHELAQKAIAESREVIAAYDAQKHANATKQGD